MTHRWRILLIEDEPGLVRVIQDLLTARGFRVQSCTDGTRGLEMVMQGDFDLLVLDVMLPGVRGYEIASRFRKQDAATPILMLTARTGLTDKVDGFRAGADDYLTKPFHPAELLLRIEALLRRAERPRDKELASYDAPGVHFDFAQSHVVRDGTVVKLSERECRLLRCFAENRGMTLSREELLRDVWDYEVVSTRTVDVHIAWLRQKIERDPRHPALIITVHGLGYRFAG